MKLIDEIKNSFKLWRYWTYRASVKFSLRHSTSRLGFLWPLISQVFVVLVIGTIWVRILPNEPAENNYYIYLLGGYCFWTIFAQTVRVGLRGLICRGTTHGSLYLPDVFERATLVSYAFINILPLLLISAGYLLYSGGNSLLALIFQISAALLGVLVWMLGVILIISTLVSWVPDMKQFIEMFMRLAFLATPIIWQPDRLGDYQVYLWMNPFFPPLELGRNAFTGISYLQGDSIWAFSYCLMVFVLGFFVFAISKNQLGHKSTV